MLNDVTRPKFVCEWIRIRWRPRIMCRKAGWIDVYELLALFKWTNVYKFRSQTYKSSDRPNDRPKTTTHTLIDRERERANVQAGSIGNECSIMRKHAIEIVRAWILPNAHRVLRLLTVPSNKIVCASYAVDFVLFCVGPFSLKCCCKRFVLLFDNRNCFC